MNACGVCVSCYCISVCMHVNELAFGICLKEHTSIILLEGVRIEMTSSCIMCEFQAPRNCLQLGV